MRLARVGPIRRDVGTAPNGLHGVLLREADRRLARAELAVRSRRAHAPSTRRGRPRARDGQRGQCCRAPIGNWFPQCVHHRSDAESKGPGVTDFKRPLACQRGGGPPRAQAEVETLGGDTGSLRIGPVDDRSPACTWQIEIAGLGGARPAQTSTGTRWTPKTVQSRAPIGNWFPQCVRRRSDAESKGPGVTDFKRPLACQRGGGPPRAQAEVETLGGDTGSLRIGPVALHSPLCSLLPATLSADRESLRLGLLRVIRPYVPSSLRRYERIASPFWSAPPTSERPASA
jgi:hypothetical protein